MGEKVRVSDLKAGDILLLEPNNEKISKIIAWVTRSEVSHTALSCGPDKPVGTVIEETPPMRWRIPSLTEQQEPPM